MPEWKFGDLMRYSKDQDPADPASWVFMFIAPRYWGKERYNEVVVIRVDPLDDLWVPGYILTAGINEMVPLDE